MVAEVRRRRGPVLRSGPYGGASSPQALDFPDRDRRRLVCSFPSKIGKEFPRLRNAIDFVLSRELRRHRDANFSDVKHTSAYSHDGMKTTGEWGRASTLVQESK